MYSFERVISARSLMGSFNPQEITNMLSYLNVEYLNLQVISPIFKTKKIKLDVDPIFGTEYAMDILPQASMDRWNNCQLNPILYLPVPNEFIPQNFTLKPVVKSGVEFPELVYNTENLRVYHLQDSKYLVPKAFYGFIFKRLLLLSV